MQQHSEIMSVLEEMSKEIAVLRAATPQQPRENMA